MDKLELTKIIKEEIQKVLSEGGLPSGWRQVRGLDKWRHEKTKFTIFVEKAFGQYDIVGQKDGYPATVVVKDSYVNRNDAIDEAEYIIKQDFPKGAKGRVRESITEGTDEIAKIFIGKDPYWLRKMGDTTHFHMANSEKGIKAGGMTYHIGQHKDELYYNDLVRWLKGGKINGKKYKGFFRQISKESVIKEGYKVGDTVQYYNDAFDQQRTGRIENIKGNKVEIKIIRNKTLTYITDTVSKGAIQKKVNLGKIIEAAGGKPKKGDLVKSDFAGRKLKNGGVAPPYGTIAKTSGKSAYVDYGISSGTFDQEFFTDLKPIGKHKGKIVWKVEYNWD